MKLVRRPFKGSFFYEWQIAALVIQIRHSPNPHFRRVHLWLDRYWR